MGEICKRFITKAQIDINTIYFLFEGNVVNEEITFEKYLSGKETNKMNILVFSKEPIPEPIKIESKYIICPKGLENTRIKIDDYKISFYKCKNDHQLKNILINEFKETQSIDESKIICDICKINNKSSIFKNQFYFCNTCKQNICPLCKISHNKEKQEHNIINYEEKNFICQVHNSQYVTYCQSCNKNICLNCQQEHKTHHIVGFGEILTNKNEIKLKEFHQGIAKLEENVKNIEDNIINKLKKVIENFKNLYNIYEGVINNYNDKLLNYEVISNINEIKIKNDEVVKELKNINEDNTILLSILTLKMNLKIYHFQIRHFR